MPRTLWTGASGMSAQQTNVDVIANNIANVNTNGFKKQRVNFQDLFYDTVVAPGTRVGDEGVNPAGIQVGNGVKVANTPRIFTNGNIEVTGIESNVAIEGDGFFRVSMPDGTEAYTRSGDFRIDPNGNLVTPDGYYLEPRITVPDNIEQLSIGPTGVVSVLQDGNQSDIGQITLTRFRNPTGLVALGRNLFQETQASGPPEEGTPLDPGYGALRGGALEKGNVDVVVELVNLIAAQRAYELNTRTITTADEMLQTANEIAR